MSEQYRPIRFPQTDQGRYYVVGIADEPINQELAYSYIKGIVCSACPFNQNACMTRLSPKLIDRCIAITDVGDKNKPPKELPEQCLLVKGGVLKTNMKWEPQQ